MKYQEYCPASDLLPFVDCYWTLRTENLPVASSRRVIPDICTDVIVNLGEEIQIWNGETHRLKSEKPYLIGTMTTFQHMLLQPGTNLAGIRFKPFGLSTLLGIRQQGMANKIEEFDRNEFPLDCGHFQPIGAGQERHDGFAKLNSWLRRQINGEDNALINRLIGTLLKAQGRIAVRELADQYATSERQLERKFGESLGVSLKEICNLIRFQHAYQLVSHRKEQSLLDIAFEAGYYDHAHLTRHFKRYAGYPPSQIG
ncbi:AraC family transcriptional regulator [Spirosoma aureum]|uniref:AraC family transcriptional regulator n=1 Tax=Spirosoma aureum TaxID=2692134 RepID=A0A6G9AS40_9BACT|nr:helix-turn-helix domain-containing protein [Spirosoma aureum]QIP15033.1 AraC family transcriptional regulator [Spirosoma aureum]